MFSARMTTVAPEQPGWQEFLKGGVETLRGKEQNPVSAFQLK